MAATVACPTCARQLRIPDELMGSDVRCPDCGGTFEAASSPRPMPDPSTAASPLGTPHSVAPAVSARAPGLEKASSPAPAEEEHPCPHCGKSIPVAMARCPHCDAELGVEEDRPWDRHQERRWLRRDCEPHRGVLVLVLGIVGLVLGIIGLPFAIIAWVLGHRDLKKMTAGAMDSEGRGLTQAGRICGIVGTMYQSLLTLFCVAYIGFVFSMVAVISRTQPPASATPTLTPVAPQPVPAQGPPPPMKGPQPPPMKAPPQPPMPEKNNP